MKTMHLICNAHLDPVWLWQWPEGAAEAVSTFRVAADLCERFDAFIFNHNEVILYRWVEEYEPPLFARIQDLVRRGRWHIMGGWHLQPDCNMPCGESFVRQGLTGLGYFREKFGIRPTTAINFDPFGHSRGLVQILAKLGYDSYLICRPDQRQCPLPADVFRWVGLDGSTLVVHRSAGYNSHLGQSRERVESHLRDQAERAVGMTLWGVGNHGGGPSRLDLEQLTELIGRTQEPAIRHSTPEAYFAELREDGPDLPRVEKDLNPFSVGCYTSQIRVKQGHRRLENELYATEKMLSAAALQGLLAYPRAELDEALADLLTCQFHDILPGSSIEPAEADALRLLDHGLEILSRLKARAFFALASGQPKAETDHYPILVYNPHPFPVEAVLEAEFQLADQNWKDEFSMPVVCRDGESTPCQPEKEEANLNLDWRKRTVFSATLAPSQMNRFDCTIKVLPRKPKPSVKAREGVFAFETDDLDVAIGARTGLIERCRIGGVDVLKAGAGAGLVIADNEDSWGMTVDRFEEVVGAFKLASAGQAAKIAGVRKTRLTPVRVIEDGDVRTVIEAIFVYGNSALVQRYKLPKRGRQIELELRVHWNERNRMLKLTLPNMLEGIEFIGQTAYGHQPLPADGREAVAQKWVAVLDQRRDVALTCINEGTYGCDCRDGELRLSLLRSAAYSGHPILDRPIVPQDRYLSRIDQGLRTFRLVLSAGPVEGELETIDRRALAYNEKPYVLAFSPSGQGKTLESLATLSDMAVQIAAFKMAEKGDAFVIRLFNPTAGPRRTTLRLPILNLEQDVSLSAFEIRTLKLDAKARTLAESTLLED